MRHLKRTVKLGRKSEHLHAMLASLVCNLIAYKRIVTTLVKAKAVKPFAEKMVTLGKKGDLASRRRAISLLRRANRVGELFANIAPAFKDRNGGYTRIVRLNRRASDSSDMAILEWVNYIPQPPKEKKKKGEKGKDKGGAAPKAKPAKAKEAEEKKMAKK